jgi:signal transduction histidine kinase
MSQDSVSFGKTNALSCNELLGIRDLSRTLVSVPDSARTLLFRAAARHLRQLVAFDLFSVLSWNSDPKKIAPLFVVTGTGRGLQSCRLLNECRPLLEKSAKSGWPVLAQIDWNLSSVTECDPNSENSWGNWLAIPILLQDETLFAVIEHTRTQAFDYRARLLCEVVIIQLANALEKADLRREHVKRGEQLVTLERIGEMIVSELDLDKTLTAIMEYVNRVFNVEAGSLLLVEGDELIFKVAVGAKGDQVKPFSLKIGQGIAGWVAQHGEPLLVANAKEDHRHFGLIDEQTDFETKSILCVPMESKGRMIGVVEIMNPLDGRLFNRDDVLVLSNIASSAAVAIENANLYESLKERAERLERAYEELREVDRLKTELVQNISHELRTPLTFIKGYVELLTSGTLGPLTPQQADALRVVAERTAVVVRLVGDIITLQRSEVGEFDFKPTRLKDVIALAAETARVSAQKAGIVLRISVPDDLPRVMIDKDRILQVFDNLLSNAIKFSPKGGEVIVRAELEADQVLVSVRDQGIGIPQDKLDKVFDRFFQVDGTMTRRYGGTGLGLAIVKKIVEAHNGKVWVKSKVNKGSIFYFTLPCVDEAQVSKLESAAIKK